MQWIRGISEEEPEELGTEGEEKRKEEREMEEEKGAEPEGLTVSDDIQQDDHQKGYRYEHCHPATNHRDLPCRRFHSGIMFIPKRRRLGSTTIIIVVIVEEAQIEAYRKEIISTPNLAPISRSDQTQTPRKIDLGLPKR
jgi:hypothetical protein